MTQFLEAIPIGIKVLDAKGKIDFINRTGIQILGKKTVAQTSIEQLSEIYHLYNTETMQLYPTEKLPVVCALQQGENGRIDNIEVRQKDKVIPLETWGAPIFDENSKITYAICAFQDITERKQAEIQREQFTQKLKMLNASLEEKVAERTTQLKQKNELIRQVFGRYLSNEVVNILLETETGLMLGGERREITMLVSDIRGFTEQSNRLSPEQVIQIVNLYLETMTNVISEYQGTIDKFMGDGILILFGAPIARTDDPERAIACGLAMQLAMDKVNEQIMDWNFSPLEMGIGINTGEVVVGNIGSEKRTQYSVLGNEVNLTYRLESYTVGGQVFISEATLKKVRHLVKIHSEQKVNPKGIKETTIIYEVVGIVGKYNLHLLQEPEKFISLQNEIPLQYTVLEGKSLGAQVSMGYLYKLSAKGALIRCEIENIPEPLTNLKVNFLTFDRLLINEDIYLKVLKQDKHTIYVRFTAAIPREVTKQMAQPNSIKLTSNLSVNHPIIDEQHQQLFSYAKVLTIVICSGKPEGISEMLGFLKDYTVTHFETEENYMRQHSYPHYATHKKQHSQFIEQINEFKEEYQKNPEGHLYLALKIQQKLVGWLTNHIGNIDKQLSVFLREKT